MATDYTFPPDWLHRKIHAEDIGGVLRKLEVPVTQVELTALAMDATEFIKDVGTLPEGSIFYGMELRTANTGDVGWLGRLRVDSDSKITVELIDEEDQNWHFGQVDGNVFGVSKFFPPAGFDDVAQRNGYVIRLRLSMIGTDFSPQTLYMAGGDDLTVRVFYFSAPT